MRKILFIVSFLFCLLMIGCNKIEQSDEILISGNIILTGEDIRPLSGLESSILASKISIPETIINNNESSLYSGNSVSSEIGSGEDYNNSEGYTNPIENSSYQLLTLRRKYDLLRSDHKIEDILKDLSNNLINGKISYNLFTGLLSLYTNTVNREYSDARQNSPVYNVTLNTGTNGIYHSMLFYNLGSSKKSFLGKLQCKVTKDEDSRVFSVLIDIIIKPFGTVIVNTKPDQTSLFLTNKFSNVQASCYFYPDKESDKGFGFHFTNSIENIIQQTASTTMPELELEDIKVTIKKLREWKEGERFFSDCEYNYIATIQNKGSSIVSFDQLNRLSIAGGEDPILMEPSTLSPGQQKDYPFTRNRKEVKISEGLKCNEGTTLNWGRYGLYYNSNIFEDGLKYLPNKSLKRQ